MQEKQERKRGENNISKEKRPLNIVDVWKRLPEDIARAVDIRTKQNAIIITPRGFLTPDMLARLTQFVNAAGGRYVSLAQGSYFQIPTDAKT
jgi:hypothetical protein